MKKAVELYTELCKLPIEEQKIFFDWAREEIKKLDKELKKKEKKNGINP
jgi:hypothetical protein